MERIKGKKGLSEALKRKAFQEGFKPGYQIGLDNFDSIFSTYTGQFITVTGVPSSGKSDFVDRMVVGYQLKYGWKTAFASPENKPTFLHAHKLMRKVGNWMPSKMDINSKKWNEVTKLVNDNFYFIENERYDLDSVLEKGAELVKRKGSDLHLTGDTIPFFRIQGQILPASSEIISSEKLREELILLIGSEKTGLKAVKHPMNKNAFKKAIFIISIRLYTLYTYN